MTERELQEAVRAMCAGPGLAGVLFHYHPHDSRRSAAGWPDSVILNWHTGRLMFRELKTRAGVLSAAQKRVGYALTAGGHDWQVWRPADLLDGTIAAQLCALAGLRQRVTA